jgi:hypothetical protein
MRVITPALEIAYADISPTRAPGNAAADEKDDGAAPTPKVEESASRQIRRLEPDIERPLPRVRALSDLSDVANPPAIFTSASTPLKSRATPSDGVEQEPSVRSARAAVA